ncbi:acyl-CoA thioesterase [Gynurincola endophyticus]|jgi:enediyne biosynthesis thioesterase|uniref:acyl-CoA thioesterase n=1 Tax=Gynurincola endophyticus TaxID=2479004 RepID=UPI0013159ED3|nr:acyl-CoA thioesterase [Gynurincola endophyticus]
MAKKYYSLSFDVLLENTNMVGNVYFSNYFSWMGKIREQFILEHYPETIDMLSKNSLALITLSCNCTFYDELFAGEKVEMRMYLESLKSYKVKMKIEYYKSNDKQISKLAAIGFHEIGCFVKENDRLEPKPFPEKLQNAFEQYA